jgi:hypothetical protein
MAVKKFNNKYKRKYYLNIDDFAKNTNFANLSPIDNTSTTTSKFYGGFCPVFNKHNKQVGTISASFLCFVNNQTNYVDISNFLSLKNGLILSWFASTNIDLIVSELALGLVGTSLCVANCKVGNANPYYGKMFNVAVSANKDKTKIKLVISLYKE